MIFAHAGHEHPVNEGFTSPGLTILISGAVFLILIWCFSLFMLSVKKKKKR